MTKIEDRGPHRDTSNWPEELFSLPNDPELFNPKAPHETAGLLRIHRAGYSGLRLTSLFKSAWPFLTNSMQAALDGEGEASRKGLKIHDEGIGKSEAAEYLGNG